MSSRISRVLALAVTAGGLGGSAWAQQTATMPPHATVFTGSTRGYWFTAPADFRITGIRVLQAPGGTNGFMNWAVLRYDGNTPPPNFPTTTNAFQQLARGFDQPSAVFSPVSIDVFTGEVIGIYGNTAAAAGTATGANSYTATGTPATTTIFGNVATLNRSGMQFHLGSTTSPQGMHDTWSEPASTAISRVEFTYEAIGVTGACCLPSGACVATTQANCAAQSGIYRGDGTTCPANCPQPPTGACCLPDLSCATLSQIACTAAGGTYRGDNVPCATAGCPTPGACCFPDGSCVSLLGAECTTASGVFRGDGSACATAACWTAPVLWKNGPLDTGATAANGAPAPAPSHWSEVQAANTTCANNVAGFSVYSSTFRLADDFVVTGGGWHLDRIIIPAYLTGSTPTASPFTQAFVQIWNGRPGDPGATVVYGDTTTNRLTGSNFSDLFRIFHTTTPPPGTAPGTTRPIYNNVLSVDVDLAPGTYWLEFSTTVNNTPATAHFAPSNTLRGLYGGRGLSANGRQLTIAGGLWADAIDGGFPAGCHPPVTQDFPFTILGTAMGGCYPDCNQDHALNVNDFICFQSAFAANAPYADCNNDQQQNVNDFICFQSAFAAGCSQL